MNVGNVEATFDIKGLKENIRQLDRVTNELTKLDSSLISSKATLNRYAKSWTDVNPAIAETIKKAQTAKQALGNINTYRDAIQGLVKLQHEYVKTTKEIEKMSAAALRAKVVASMSAQRTSSGFNKMSKGSTPLGGQTSNYTPFTTNSIMRSWNESTLAKINSGITTLTKNLHSAAGGAKAFLTPSQQIQDVFSNWWNHFGRIGIGFGVIYGGIRAVTQAATYFFQIFAGGIKVMDDIRSSGAMVAGMLALVTKNGKDFTENYTNYFNNFQTTLSRAMVLLPQYGLTMEQFMTGARELAQFGVVIDNDNLEQSIASMKIVQEIASNLKGDTKQIRQELQSFFTGQTRLSEQFGLMIKNSMPELRGALERIRKEGGTTQQMWEKLNAEMFKMAPSLKAANANLEVQHTVLKASLSVISAMALDATGLYDIWLKGLTDFNGKLFNVSGNLTEFGLQIYKVFFKAWEWTKDWGLTLLGIGQIVYGGVIKPFLILWELLVDIKNSIIRMGREDLSKFATGMAQLITKDFAGAFKTFKSLGALEDAKEAGLNVIQGLVDEGKIILKGLENFAVGTSLVMTDDYTGPTLAMQQKAHKALTGLLAPDKDGDDKGTKAAATSMATTFVDQLTYDLYAQVKDYFSTGELEAMMMDFQAGWKLRFAADDMGPPERVRDWGSSEIEYWNAIIAAQKQYTGDLDARINREALLANIKAQAAVTDFFPMKMTAEEYKTATELVLAEQKRISTNWDFELAKMNLSFDSFGTYLGSSFKGLFTSVFNHEITSFGQLFTGVLKSIQDSFSSMLSDMVSEWFSAMMEMQFRDNAVGIMGKMFGGAASAYTGMGSANYTGGGTPADLGINWATYPNYAGGMINEPVFGIGQNSGASYSFAERGPERVLSNKESKDYGSSGAPNVTINFTNESSVPLTATQSGMSFDGEKYVTSIIVKQMSTNPSFRSSMRG